jgi:chitodextrinase
MEEGAAVPAAGDGVRAWTRSWVYDAGEIVAHGGHTYRAKWWTRNQEPGAKNSPWEDLGAY